MDDEKLKYFFKTPIKMYYIYKVGNIKYFLTLYNTSILITNMVIHDIMSYLIVL